MDSSRILRHSRRRAGLTQRGLAELAGVKQPVIARIESGASEPRMETMERLLKACGFDLELAPRLGIGIDRSVIRELLKLTPRERLDLAAQEADVLEVFRPKTGPAR